MDHTIDLEHDHVFRDLLVDKDVHDMINVEGQHEGLFLDVPFKLKVRDVLVLSLRPVFDRVANLKCS